MVTKKNVTYSGVIAAAVVSIMFCCGINLVARRVEQLPNDEDESEVMVLSESVPDIIDESVFYGRIADINGNKITVASLAENFSEMPIMELLPEDDGEVHDVSEKSEKYDGVFVEADIDECAVSDENGIAVTNDYLKKGMSVYMRCEEVITDTVPGRLLGLKHIRVEEQSLDFSDLYYDIISIINNDDGNRFGNLQLLAFDLNGVYNLAQAEKNELVYRIQNCFGIDAVLSSYEELEQNGLIDSKSQTFANGALFTIEIIEDSNGTLSFSISKWQSDTCAVGYPLCVAEYNDEEQKWEFVSRDKWTL